MRTKILLLLTVFYISLFVSCGINRYTKTVTIKEIDTVIVTHFDTSRIFVEVLPENLMTGADTIILIKENAEARAFYNIETQKIEFSLKVSNVDLPVILKQKETIKERTPTKSNTWTKIIYFVNGVLFGIVVFALYLMIFYRK